MVTTVAWLTGELTPIQQARVRCLENREWLDDHIFELQTSHPNQWVAILDRSIAAAGADYQAIRQAVGDRIREAVIMRIPTGDIPRPI